MLCTYIRQGGCLLLLLSSGSLISGAAGVLLQLVCFMPIPVKRTPPFTCQTFLPTGTAQFLTTTYLPSRLLPCCSSQAVRWWARCSWA